MEQDKLATRTESRATLLGLIVGTCVTGLLFAGIFYFRIALAMLGRINTPSWVMLLAIPVGWLIGNLTAKQAKKGNFTMAYIGFALIIFGILYWWWL